MKNLKYANIVWVMILAAIALWSLSTQFFHSDVKRDRYRYTFVCPLSWGGAAAGIEAADQKNSVYTKLVGSSAVNPGKMADAMQEAIYSGVDGIITAGVQEADELKGFIHQAREKNIPVILIDSDIPESDRLCYVGQNNYSEGKKPLKI